MKRDVLLNSKVFIVAFTLLLSQFAQMIVLPIPTAKAANDLSSACVIGSNSACPAQSPQEIYNLYGTTTNGTYWLNVNGTATQTYLILDRSYPDSGGWFLGMKSSKGSTNFTYSSTYWTSQSTTLNTGSLSDDVSTDAKFNAFNYLPATQLVAVFKDRNTYGFNSSGSGDLGTNLFGGHTWKENVTSTTMFSRFTTYSNLVDGSGYRGRYTLTRETNSSSGKLVFPYQTGWSRYGFNNSTGYNYRWGMTYNNESSMGSNDSGSGIGLDSYSSAAIVSYSDNLTVGPNGGSGASNPGSFTYPSGFQIWGKMAAPSLATPGSISVTNQGNGNVQLTFAASTGATEYAIQYKSAGGNWSSSTTYRLTNPGATPTALIPGITQGSYDFRVFARSTNNSSPDNSYVLAQSIDATAPAISSISVTSTSGSDGIYSLGDLITVSVNWSETVTVTGTPRIPIQGLSSKFLNYSSGSGSPTTLFTYTVASGDLDRDGFSISASTLVLNSGSIIDSANNSAILTHSAVSIASNLQIDGVLPTLLSSSISSDGEVLTLVMSETMSSTIASTGAFTVMVGGVRNAVVSSTVSNNEVELVLTFAVISSSSVTVAYEDPSGSNDTNALQDEGGNDAASLSATQVLNNSTRSSNTSASLALNPISTLAVYRAPTTIKATVSTFGKVTFYQNGKVIPSCRRKSVTGSGPYVAICSWKPSVQNYVNLKASFIPSENGFMSATTELLRIYVTKRGGLR